MTRRSDDTIEKARAVEVHKHEHDVLQKTDDDLATLKHGIMVAYIYSYHNMIYYSLYG